MSSSVKNFPLAHIRVIDGLRGMAILMVLFIHLSHTVAPGSIVESYFNQATKLGWIGVDLFFVISGFLITRILLDTKHNDNCLQNFYARRTLRIFPLYYLTLTLFLVLLPTLGLYKSPESKALVNNQAWFWLYGTNILAHLTPGNSLFILTHFWSLAIEEQFYLGWPLIVRFSPTKSLIRVCCLIVLLSPIARLAIYLLGIDLSATFLLTPCRIDSLVAGAFVALLNRIPGSGERLLSKAYWAMIFSLIGLCALYFRRFNLDRFNDPAFAIIGYTLLATLFSSCIAILCQADPNNAARRFLESQPLLFFGKYSYGLYVFHWPIFILCGRVWDVPNRIDALLHNRKISITLFWLLAASASVGTAFASYWLIERHFLRLKRYFE